MHNIMMTYIEFFKQRIKLAEDLLLLPQLSTCGCNFSLSQIKDRLYAFEIQLRLEDQFNAPAFHYNLTEHLN